MSLGPLRAVKLFTYKVYAFTSCIVQCRLIIPSLRHAQSIGRFPFLPDLLYTFNRCTHLNVYYTYASGVVESLVQ